MKKSYTLNLVKTASDDYIKDIKQAMVDKGIVEETVPDNELDEAISSFEGIVETWETVDLESKKKYFVKQSYNYVYYHSNGIDCYGSYNVSTQKGLWHWNAITGEETQISSYGNSWCYFFESSNGDLYVSFPQNSGIGIYHIKGTQVTEVYSKLPSWKFFYESTNGNIYVGSQASGTGIVCIKGTQATNIYTISYYWQYFFEDSKGNVYASGSFSGSSPSVLHINNDTLNVSGIYTGAYFNYFYESAAGDVYMSNRSTGYGILHVKDTTATLVYSSGFNWINFVEFSNGDLYVSSNSTSGANIFGLIYLSGTTAKQIISNGVKWTVHFEDGDYRYISTTDNAQAYANGLYKLDKETITQIYTSGNNWGSFFKSNSGKLYVSSLTEATSGGAPILSPAAGIFTINGDTVTQIYAFKSYSNFIERPEGIIVSQTPQPDGSDFILIDKDTDQIYLVKE